MSGVHLDHPAGRFGARQIKTAVLALTLGGVALLACAASQTAGWLPNAPTHLTYTIVRPSTTAPPIATAAPPATMPPAASPTPEPAATAVPQPPISEVLPAVQAPTIAPPAPTAVRGGSALTNPADTTVVWGGCASDGECHWYNFYWAPTHEVVMQNGEPQHKVQHELCHAHQHWSINGGTRLDPSDYDLESWYSTSEGESFTSAVAGLPWPWDHSAMNSIEDFAWTCAYWYFDASYLLRASPERYQWALNNLP